eukprot:TRINITY_DN23148_c0_g4_i1.p1 TRINITY_DN23148_c0_g4~~TRINITY_DN23148_c0_g4_i1.p1  ORF type:complete len:765 (-),score=110.69 TRINITY_DN23148_c0_g4_i1:104-2398(-)
MAAAGRAPGAMLLRSTLDLDRGCVRIAVPPGLNLPPNSPVQVQAPEILGMAVFPIVLPAAAYQRGGQVEVGLQHVPRAMACPPRSKPLGTHAQPSGDLVTGSFASDANESCLFLPSMVANFAGYPKMDAWSKAPELPPWRRVVPVSELPEALQKVGPLERHKYDMVRDHERKCRSQTPKRQRLQAPPPVQAPSNVTTSLLHGGLSCSGSSVAEFKRRRIEYADHCGRLLMQRLPPQDLTTIAAAEEIEETYNENEELRQRLEYIDALFESGALEIAATGDQLESTCAMQVASATSAVADAHCCCQELRTQCDTELAQIKRQCEELERELASCRQELAANSVRYEAEIASVKSERHDLELSFARYQEKLLAKDASYEQLRSQFDADFADLRRQRDKLEIEFASCREELEIVLCASLEGADAKDAVVALREEIHKLEATCNKQKQEIASLQSRRVGQPQDTPLKPIESFAAKPQPRQGSLLKPLRPQPQVGGPGFADEMHVGAPVSSPTSVKPLGTGAAQIVPRHNVAAPQTARAPPVVATAQEGISGINPRASLSQMAHPQLTRTSGESASVSSQQMKTVGDIGVAPQNGKPSSHMCTCSSGVQRFETRVANFSCDKCQKRFGPGACMYGCRTCDFDLCESCYHGPKAVMPSLPTQYGSASYYAPAIPRASGGHESHVFAASYGNYDVEYNSENYYFVPKVFTAPVMGQVAQDALQQPGFFHAVPRCEVLIGSVPGFDATPAAAPVRATPVHAREVKPDVSRQPS